jgi:NUDIX domain
MKLDGSKVARVLVIKDQNDTYLFRGRDLATPEQALFWFTPGGKVDPGETLAAAACRELLVTPQIVYPTYPVSSLTAALARNQIQMFIWQAVSMRL